MTTGSGDRRWALKSLGAAGLNALLSACSGGVTLGDGSGGGSGSGSLWPAASIPIPPPGVPQPIPFGPTTSAVVGVSTKSAGAVAAQFGGLSYTKDKLYQGLLADTDSTLAGCMRALGSGILRMNPVDYWDSPPWKPSGAGLTYQQIAPSDVDRLAKLAKATGWKVIYGLQLAGSTPAAAASEAAYVVKALGDSLASIDIGNEPDQFATSSPPIRFAPPEGFSSWTYAAYLTDWRQFRSAILQASPNAPISGPATGSGVNRFFAPFAQDVGSEVVELTHHYYRADGAAATSTPQQLITADPLLITMLGELMAVSRKAGLPFRMEEAGNYWGSGSPSASPSYASALWVIDFLFEIALAGAVGVNLQAENANYYTPIVDNGKSITAIRPQFYGMLLFAMAGQGSLLTTTLSATGLNVTAYCIETAVGKSVVIVNKDSLENLNLTLNFPGAVKTATAIVMTGPSLTSLSGVEIQGASIGLDGSISLGVAYTLPIKGGSSVQVYAPPLTAVLVRVA